MDFSRDKYQKYLERISEENKDTLFAFPLLLNYSCLLFLQKDSKNALLISLDKEKPLVCMSEYQKHLISLENEKYLQLKKLIDDFYLIDVCLSNLDNVIAIKIKQAYFPNEEKIIYVLLIKNQPNVILCNKDNKIEHIFLEYKNYKYNKNDIFKIEKSNFKDGNIDINNYIQNVLEIELEKRNNDKYLEVYKTINNKIKHIDRKINNIKDDIKVANETINKYTNIDYIFSLGLDLSKHQKEVVLNDEIIQLDQTLSIKDNINNIYKRIKKAKETIRLANDNIAKANNEKDYYLSFQKEFDAKSEKEKDVLKLQIIQSKKKKETFETPFNKPYKINYCGTIIYFGKNANQNDYLSFSKKLDRDFTWLHVKNYTGSHLVIASKTVSEKLLLVASSIALQLSHLQTGEVSYTKKKNVRRGKFLGQAILKNYSTIKINNVSPLAKELIDKAKRD